MKIHDVINANVAKVYEKKEKATKKPSQNSLKVQDKVEISAEAKRVSEELKTRESLLEDVRKSPDIRQDKVEQASRRVREGYYNRPEIQEQIVEELSKLFGI